jgi:XTP/dITP diphosphohydrolase
MVRRLVLASSNAAKLRELQALLAPLGWDVIAQHEVGVLAAAEPHPTFIENALAKARHAAAVAGLPALADDSGLCVDTLGGAPGVLSARFAGQPGNDVRNNAELLRRLQGSADRSAHYACVLTALRAADDPEPLVAVARWHGEIAEAPRGYNGFGYDPLFLLPALGRTAAELEPEHKNRISHRALAMAELARNLAEWR